MGKLDRDEKVYGVGEGELIIHFDCNDEFLNGLVDNLISACISKRCSMQHSWASDGRSERLILKLPAVGD